MTHYQEQQPTDEIRNISIVDKSDIALFAHEAVFDDLTEDLTPEEIQHATTTILSYDLEMEVYEDILDTEHPQARMGDATRKDRINLWRSYLKKAEEGDYLGVKEHCKQTALEFFTDYDLKMEVDDSLRAGVPIDEYAFFSCVYKLSKTNASYI